VARGCPALGNAHSRQAAQFRNFGLGSQEEATGGQESHRASGFHCVCVCVCVRARALRLREGEPGWGWFARALLAITRKPPRAEASKLNASERGGRTQQLARLIAPTPPTPDYPLLRSLPARIGWLASLSKFQSVQWLAARASRAEPSRAGPF